MARAATKKPAKEMKVESLTHKEVKRTNIPTAETQSFMQDAEAAPKKLLYKRNPDLDPQLVWRGKDAEDSQPLAVDAVPIYIQEKIHPQQIINDLKRMTKQTRQVETDAPDLFHDFNGLPDPEAKLEFYAHEQNWTNRMILGDSLLVMNSLAEKEKLRGRVQMIYIDPPYGIKFGSNWQPSTKKNSVKDGKQDEFSREPEVIKAFRDTWKNGIHSYLSYLRDRLTIARELLTESGSVFVQIGEENSHFVRNILDEVFGASNYISQVQYVTTSTQGANLLPTVNDTVIWYAKNKATVKYRQLYSQKIFGEVGSKGYSYAELEYGKYIKVSELQEDFQGNARFFAASDPTSSHYSKSESISFQDKTFTPGNRYWSTSTEGMYRLAQADRLMVVGTSLRYKRWLNDFNVFPLSNVWTDTGLAGFSADRKVYVVQTNTRVIERCILMATDPGDLVIDPTCGGGTTAFVAEQFARRWITIDTSRVSLALARTRLMSAKFSFYYLRDTAEGAQKEAEITGKPTSERAYSGNISAGFVYERVPHITLKSIANNAEIDVIYDRHQPLVDQALKRINEKLKKDWKEWEVPRELPAGSARPEEFDLFWATKQQRQKEIDASIARNADIEYLYDRPYEDKNRVRVTGPFTVESLSPHRVLPAGEDDWLLDAMDEEARARGEEPKPRPVRSVAPQKPDTDDDFVRVVLENLKISGVQNTKKNERMVFSEVKPWAGGKHIHAEARYMERDKERRAGILIGPEYGTVSYRMVVEAAKEAVQTGFDVLVACGFAFEPNIGDDTMNLGKLTVLKARMNQELHMKELKNTGAGNLFVVFGEPDLDIKIGKDDMVTVRIKGLDVFDPTSGTVRDNKGKVEEDIACWFIDTDYDEMGFFVRQAYFLGDKDPYDKLKRTLKAEIDESAWETLYRSESRPFPKPSTGKIAVKVINHYGDEVLRVYEIS